MDHLVVSIHQPNYLPWLGYFFKIFISDIFIILDDVEYSSSSLTKRCFIRKQKFSMDKNYLSIPLRKHHNHSLIQDLSIDHEQAWQQKQLHQLSAIYKSSKYFDQYFPFVEKLIQSSRQHEKLVDFNEFIIMNFLELLDIPSTLIRSSTLPISGHKASYVINLVEHFKATTYFSGTGAKKYQTEVAFLDKGINLKYNDIYHFLTENPYPQTQGSFLNGLCILDALFNIGAEEILTIFEKYKLKLAIK